jgi:hypothetical protein
MIEDTSSAAWYQQSTICLENSILWSVKECVDDFECHYIKQLNLYDDFYFSLKVNQGLPPSSLDEIP